MAAAATVGGSADLRIVSLNVAANSTHFGGLLGILASVGLVTAVEHLPSLSDHWALSVAFSSSLVDVVPVEGFGGSAGC